KKNSQKTVICSIHYCKKNVRFQVAYGNKPTDYVESKESPSVAANLYQK
ncbi:22225_t:CDS:1, partial [Gigaspora margarita]